MKNKNETSAYAAAYSALREICPGSVHDLAPGSLFSQISNSFETSTWNKLYSIICNCGMEKAPSGLIKSFISKLPSLCGFDQVWVYYLDGNRKPVDEYLVNIDPYWSSAYLNHYADMDGGRYSLFATNDNADQARTEASPICWEEQASESFVPQYIRPRGLKYSLGFCLRDMNGRIRTMVSLDRTQDVPFRPEELTALYLLIPQLNNLHKNFFYEGFNIQKIQQDTGLTERESEVAALLCQGVSPANISNALYISRSTTYKHIAHIYEKLNVRTRQELMVRLLGNNPQPDTKAAGM